MNQPKRNPNPFVRMAQEAKERKLQEQQAHGTVGAPKKQTEIKSQVVGGAAVVRRSGRGG